MCHGVTNVRTSDPEESWGSFVYTPFYNCTVNSVHYDGLAELLITRLEIRTALLVFDMYNRKRGFRPSVHSAMNLDSFDDCPD